MDNIQSSELILNEDGSIFHLHLKPEDIADTVVLVGDPSRVNLIATYFDTIETEVANREFRTITGYYNNKRLTVLSTGIGTDNIDIVLNELDALVNIDLKKKLPKRNLKSLNIIRIGTSGSLQTDIPIDSFVLSTKSIGFDGVLNFYKNRNEVSDLDFEKAFTQHTGWNTLLAKPYVVNSSEELIEKLSGDKTINGVTISANGFYGPQGRVLRLDTADNELNSKIAAFEYQGKKITNYEMESSAIAGLSKLMGHNAITICAIIANRATGNASPDYHKTIRKLIEYTLEKITE